MSAPNFEVVKVKTLEFNSPKPPANVELRFDPEQAAQMRFESECDTMFAKPLEFKPKR